MQTFPQRCNKRKFLVIAALILVNIILMAQMRKGKIVTAPPPVRPLVEQQERRTALPARRVSEGELQQRCQHRIDLLDGPGPDEEWHIGGWAVRQICRQPLDTLFFVHTAPKNWKRRAHLRATLFEEAARTAFNWTGIFFVGEHDDPLVDLWTKLEAEVVGDVVMLPYNDTYFTILYKFVGGMRWVTEYCPNVRNIVKIDDDVGVQPFELRRYLDEELPRNNNSIHCYVFAGARVHRHTRSIYCVPEDELAQDTYPMYCSGRSMIMTMDMLGKLFRASKIVKGFAIDDAYVSGHLALFANVGHVNIKSRLGWGFRDKTKRLLRGSVIFTHEYSGYGTSIGRRGQWGLMLWMHMMQAPGRHALKFTDRRADKLYQRDFIHTRRALEEGQYLPSLDYYRYWRQDRVGSSHRSFESVK